MAYVDLDSVHNPATGNAAPAAWGDQVRDNFVALRKPNGYAGNNNHEVIADSSTHTCVMTNTLYDRHSNIWSGGAPSNLVIPETGIWLLTAQIEWDANATGRRFAQFFHNTLGSLGETDLPASAASKTSFPVVIIPKEYTAGDIINVKVYQTSGGNLSCLVAAAVTFIGEGI